MSRDDIFGGPDDGRWDPDHQSGRGHKNPYRSEPAAGLRVVLSRRKGLTGRRLLKHAFVFQTAPLDELTRTHGGNHSDYDTLRGQRSRPVGRQLRVMQFRTLFLDYHWYWTRGDEPPNAVRMADELVEISESLTPFRLRIGNPQVRPRWEVDMLATLRTVEVTEQAGEPDSRYVNVSFTEYRASKVPRRERRLDFPLHREVTKDATLADLSKKFYGAHRFWREIHKANDMGKAVSATTPLGPWMKRTGKKKLTIPEPPKGAHPPKPGQ